MSKYIVIVYIFVSNCNQFCRQTLRYYYPYIIEISYSGSIDLEMSKHDGYHRSMHAYSSSLAQTVSCP